MNAPNRHPFTTGTIGTSWTTQDGVSRGYVRSDSGQHIVVELPFSSQSLEGRRVHCVDGVWKLVSARRA